MSVVSLCPIFYDPSFSLLVSELQSPYAQLCVLNRGVKLTRNAGREHFGEQSLATSHLLFSTLTTGAKKGEATLSEEG